jgi:hypothetical protein
MSVFHGTKWKGNQLVIEEAKQHFLQKLERERQQNNVDSCIDSKKISKKSLRKRAVSHASNMSLVRNASRKGWVRLKDGRLVSKFKVRIPSTGRQTVIDPVKYESNHKKFNIASEANISITQLHFTNHDMEDLSRDALKVTSETQRKRAGIFTEEELALAKKASIELKMKEEEARKEFLALGINRKKKFLLEVEKEKLENELSSFKLIAQEVSKIGKSDQVGIVDFLSSDEEEYQKPSLVLNGAFDSDSE